MRIIRILTAALCLSCLCAPSAFAADDVPQETERYIVYLSEQPKTRGIGLTAVPYAEGYYIAESAEDARALLQQGSAELAAPNETLELLDRPDDPALDEQWYLDVLGMDELWDTDYTGAGVTVAVIDSGVYYEHEEFRGAAVSGHNFLGSGDMPEAYGDDHGHGTLVAGILAAGRDNGTGGTGLTPRVSVMALRCFSAQSGSANSGNGELDTILSAIGWAIQNHADVINMSLGGTSKSLTALEPILRQAADAGVLIVSAVGNNGGTALYYPAAFDCVTGVGWTDKNGTVLSQHNQSVFVTAPGSSVYGPALGKIDAYSGNNKGSSFSTPMVSALAVMAKQADKAIDCAGFQRLLRLCARDMGAGGWDEYYGWGLVSAAAFVQALEAPQPIVYECAGGRVTAEDAPDTYRIGHGAEVVLPDHVTREGYTFAGWYRSADYDGEPLTCVPTGSVGDVTLYAKWEPATAIFDPRSYFGEDGTEFCAATFRLVLPTAGMAYAARYDAEGRLLSCDSMPMQAGETVFAVPLGDAVLVRFFLLDTDAEPLTAVLSDGMGKLALCEWEPEPAVLDAHSYIGEGGAEFCAATIRCGPSVHGSAYAARFDADGRFLGCETMTLTAGKSEFAVPPDGADAVRFFLLSADGAPISPRAEVPVREPAQGTEKSFPQNTDM